MDCVLSGLTLNGAGNKINSYVPTYCLGTPQNSSRFLKRCMFLKAPLLLEDIHFVLASPTFAHEKIHHCVYKCQIAMQIGICVPNYPFCVFAKRMCRQILQVWVGSLLETWLPLSQHQIRCYLLTVLLRGKRPSLGQPFSVVPGVDSTQKVHAERKILIKKEEKNQQLWINNWSKLGLPWKH